MPAHEFVIPGHRMKCPHCRVMVTFEKPASPSYEMLMSKSTDPEDPGSVEYGVSLHVGVCPACRETTVDEVHWVHAPFAGGDDAEVERVRRLFPPTTPDVSDSPHVPADVRQDLSEARLVAKLSPRSAAMLARRALQRILRLQGYKAKSLAQEIEKVEDNASVSPTLKAKFHIVREVGNFAAHPTEDGAGLQLQVEPGEVEALLGAVAEACDTFYVKPAETKALLESVNAKLRSVGKNPIELKEDALAPSGPGANRPRSGRKEADT